MTITVLANVILSNRIIEGGVRGRQMRRNSRVSTVNGQESINIVWTQTLREYELGFIPMLRAGWIQIESLHEVTEGGAYGFLMQDPKDSSVTSGGVVAGLGSNTFQLYKRYTEPVSGRIKDRKITRPSATGFALFISGAPQAPAAFTLDTTTGIVTIPANPSPSVVAWTGNFYVPVHFLEDSVDWEMIAPHQDPDARFLAGPSVVLQEIRE